MALESDVLRLHYMVLPYNMELNDLRIITCLRKYRVSVERISICNVEKMAKHGIHCLPCSYTNDVINLLPQQLWNYKILCQVSR